MDPLQWPSVKSLIHQLPAARVVVKPWLGRHNVYAIFLVPCGFYPEKLMVLDFQIFRQAYLEAQLIVNVSDISALDIPAGYYPLKTFLRTRYALSLILLGWGQRLRACENWILLYSHREKYISDGLARIGKPHRQRYRLLNKGRKSSETGGICWRIRHLCQLNKPRPLTAVQGALETGKAKTVWLTIDWREAYADISELQQEQLTEIIFQDTSQCDDFERVERLARAQTSGDDIGNSWLWSILTAEVTLRNLKFWGFEVQKRLPGKPIKLTLKVGGQEITVKNMRPMDLDATLDRLMRVAAGLLGD